MYLENFDLTDTDLLLSDVSSPFLVFAPFALQPGVEYLFEAVVSVTTRSINNNDADQSDEQSLLLQGK